MTAKTITLALAATTAAAVLADVVEVKFTVKTKVGEKVANKVISGLYDYDTQKHVFWTVEKLPQEVKGKTKYVNTNVAYTGTYFGPANDTVVGKSYGTNAELIWGDAQNPENVLVAGGWGKATSLSGQAAGMLDNVPANGTWSAKVNTKKTFEQLLVSKKVVGYDFDSIRKDSVIKDRDGNIASLDEAVKEALETIAKHEATIKEQEGTIADKNTEIDGLNKDIAKTDAALSNAYAVIEQYVADLAATNATLAAQAEALKDAEKQIETIEGALKDIDSSELPNMITDYLDDTEDEAKQLIKDATAKISEVELAYTNYTNALDLTDVIAATNAAQAAYDTTNGLYEAAKDYADALSYTNKMFEVIYSNGLQTWYEGEQARIKGLISTTEDQIIAAKSGFVTYTNELQRTINEKAKEIDTPETGLAALEKKAHDKYIVASNDLATVKEKIASFPKAAKDWDTEYKEHLDYDAFVADKGGLDVGFGGDAVAARAAWNEYCQEEFEKAEKDLKETQLTSATLTAATKKGSWILAHTNLTNAQTILKDTKDKLDAAVEANDFDDEWTDGSLPPNTWQKDAIKTLTDEKDALKQDLKDLDSEYTFWQNYEYSDAQAKEVKEVLLPAAEQERDALETEKGKAETTLANAKNDYNKQVTDQTTTLQNLALLICTKEDPVGTGTYVADQNGLDDIAGDVEAIRAKVDAFLNAPLGGVDGYMSLNDMVTAGNRMLKAIANIRAALKIK